MGKATDCPICGKRGPLNPVLSSTTADYFSCLDCYAKNPREQEMRMRIYTRTGRPLRYQDLKKRRGEDYFETN